MLKNPLILGIDNRAYAGQDFYLEDLLNKYGNNTGNMWFSEALFRGLQGGIRSHLHFEDHEVDKSDVIVIAAANWLNPYDDFGWLADHLETINKPVVIIGLGAQAELEGGIPSVKEGTLRLIKLISERSAAISVRGTFSAEVLHAYGIKNVLVTGCPSLLLSGPRPPDLKEVTNLKHSDCVINSTRHLFWGTAEFHNSLYRYGLKHQIDIVLQSELSDMYHALNRLNNDFINTKIESLLEESYHSSIEKVSKYLQNHARVFFDIDVWIEFMRSKRFCFGTRAHGIIASLIAGVPAVLIAHDTRTLELAVSMNIPVIKANKVRFDRRDFINGLCDDRKMREFSERYEEYYLRFMAFFAINDLEFLETRLV